MNFVGGIYFSGSLGEDLPGHLGLRQLIEEAVLQHRIDLKGVAQTHLLLGQAGQQGQLFVDQVGSQHRVSLLDRVGCGEVVVLARVDDYAGEAVDYARHILIDQRALHIDVPEEDAVQGVVQHHIQTFECAHYGDLGHAEARAVVAQADVAADLFAYFVQSLAHDAEVLLGGERTAESLGRRAVGHVVEQALARGADYGDDVGALSGCGLCLYDIFVDVTRRYDYVEVGARPFADGGDVVFSTLAVGCDFGDAGVDIRFQRRFALGCRTYGRAGDVEFAGSDLLRRFAGA